MSLWESFRHAHEKTVVSDYRREMQKAKKRRTQKDMECRAARPRIPVLPQSPSPTPQVSIPPYPTTNTKSERRGLSAILLSEQYYGACERKEIRTKAISLAKKKTAECATNRTDCYTDGTKVVHRRREDWSQEQGYTACSFLGEYDTALALNRSGTIDVVRLSPFDRKNEGQPRKLGRVLVDSLALPKEDTTTTPPKLKSLQGGNSFVIGMGGSYHVFVSERIQEWWTQQHRPAATFSQDSRNCFLAGTWSFHGPRRKYHRDLQQPDLSLVKISNATAPNCRQLDIDHDVLLSEILGWNSGNPKDHPTLTGTLLNPRRKIPQSSRWDFFETSSSFLAAKVDAGQDAFWLRVMDGRLHQPVVCVDPTSKDAINLQTEEHITACAFASETCLATSHVICTSPSNRLSTPINGKKPSKANSIESLVKLWDIRMLSNVRKENSISTIFIPSFPCDVASNLHPAATIDTGFVDGANDVVIHSLSGGHRLGTLMVTAQSQRHSTATHYLLNLGRLGFDKVYHQKDKGDTLLYSVSEDHETLASIEDPQHEIKLINVPAAMDENLFSGKRQTDGSPKNYESASQIPLDLKDRHGLDTQLSCIAMNPDGTSILGGSVDNDLFLWRGG